MDCFFVDGNSKSFADIILQHRVDGKKCLVASYGFGVLQIRKIINAFDFVSLVADISHSKLNEKAYCTVVEMATVLPNFSFITTKTHAKLALIDDEIIIFTSANLSANRRIESYVIGSMQEFPGIEKFKKLFTNTSMSIENLESINENNFKVVRAKYLQGDINEPRYTHIVDDKKEGTVSSRWAHP